MIPRTVATALLAALAIVSACESTPPVIEPPVDEEPAPGTEVLAFARLAAGRTTLVLADDDGRERTVSFGETKPVGAIQWSPDGTRLAIAIGGGLEGSTTVILDVATGSITDLGLPAYPLLNHTPMWSPTGDYLAIETHDGTAVLTPTGERIATLPGGINTFDWSPAGDELAFFLGLDSLGDAGFRLIDLDGNRRTVGGDSEALTVPRWSPDGRYIASFNRLPYLIEIATDELTPLAHDQFWAVSDLVWSPDGTAMAVYGATSDSVYVARLDVATGVATSVWPTYAGTLSWAPDSRWVALVVPDSGYRATDIRVIDTLTGATRIVNDAGNEFNPAWRP